MWSTKWLYKVYFGHDRKAQCNAKVTAACTRKFSQGGNPCRLRQRIGRSIQMQPLQLGGSEVANGGASIPVTPSRNVLWRRRLAGRSIQAPVAMLEVGRAGAAGDRASVMSVPSADPTLMLAPAASSVLDGEVARLAIRALETEIRQTRFLPT